MKTTRLLSYTFALFMIASALIFSSCSKSNNSTPQQQDQPTTGISLTADAKFGNILTDNNGRTLYFFYNDAGTTSSCTGGCAVAWPVFYKENPSIGTGLSAADFGVITRTDGSKQTTYKGWPLYYFASDAKKGDVNGDGVGGNWVVAKADYTVMVANGQLVGHDGANYNDQGLAGTGASMYLTDANGRTLYLFSKDTHNTNVFTKSDFSNDVVWPIDQVTAIGSIPSTLDKTQFATITVFGKTQLVFKGHPLYYFGQDNAVKGSTKGISFPTPGAAIWKVVNSNTPVL
ncbi:hypothetical protein MUY27_02185 [Mucilaginibacter sp. RS28]|uniref:Secreted repeat protein with Y-X4-D motif n=1 Tax=Mucilaginibacter straminoryzae TaxID=2932774 RepID=A0A9X2B897_9SPHI|nr:hypothetical protein [Mucilaginibacter straminoryzae]MCJ8208500.1 hypothetical protein [Mucilaginibacter straminoryzae]